MQIVIDIDEAQKRMVDAIADLPPQVENDLISAIRHGTPLPKGHEYIDRNNAITSICQFYTARERTMQVLFLSSAIKQDIADILMQEPTLTTDKEQD